MEILIALMIGFGTGWMTKPTVDPDQVINPTPALSEALVRYHSGFKICLKELKDSSKENNILKDLIRERCEFH